MTGRLAAILCLPLAAALAQPAAPGDPVLRALADELERSRTLRLVDLNAPYYIEYGIHHTENFAASATLGALNGVQKARGRLPRIQVRVGDYQYDSGNYIYSDLPLAGRYELGSCPIDDDYLALRQYFWLGTDAAYKSALEALARKRAAQKNLNLTGQLPDLLRIEPATLLLPWTRASVDEEGWKARLRRLSAVFAAHPVVLSSTVEFQHIQGVYYLVTSEGARVRIPEGSAHFRVRASALAPDGMVLRDSAGFLALEAGGIPPEAALQAAVEGVAANLSALVKAPLGEAYTGPVLFEPEAAAQLFAEILGRSFVLRRRPVTEPGAALPFTNSDFEGRLGARVLPEWMDVVDDPAAREFGGRRLIGGYPVDLEGVAPKTVTLVEKGILRGYLTTRQPVQGVDASNGRARLPGSFGANTAAPSNLFIRASRASTLAELKQRLMTMASQANRPYGILVRRMDFPSSASLAEAQRLLRSMAQDGNAARAVSVPILVYRVYADGREELVRGLRFRDLTVRSFRDIVAAGGEPAVFDYLENGATFALMGAGAFVAETSVVSPGILFEELQLTRAQEDLTRYPLVPPPPLGAVR
jgi:predicted Zn-dependent protease